MGWLEFEGATKKNKPELSVGSLVYCKVNEFNKYLAVELTCKSRSVKKDWNSGEALYGELKNGYEINVPIFFSHFLLNNEILFNNIKRRITFEVYVGINGVLWIKTKVSENYLILEEFFKQAPFMRLEKAIEVLSQFCSKLKDN